MTFNQNNLKDILNDLYQIDSSLKEHEPELVKLINELITAKPTAEPDTAFQKRLRQEILSLAQELKQGTVKEDLSWGFPLIAQFFKPAAFIAVGALLTVLITSPWLFDQPSEPEIEFSVPTVLEQEQAVFGEEAMPRAADSAEAGLANHTYDYTGEDFTIEQAQMPVYQKTLDETYQPELKEVERDVARIIKLAEQREERIVGAWAAKNFLFELGTPKQIYFKTQGFSKGKLVELLVPGLSFPVIKAPQELTIDQQNVIIPLIKEMLE